MASISLSMVVSEGDYDYLEPALKSADFCEEVFIVNQGFSRKVSNLVKSIFPKAIVIPTSLKGFCEPDRILSISAVKSEFALILDSDERVSPELRQFITEKLEKIKEEYDVFFIPFKNLVDSVDIQDILGNDYHPRLHRPMAVVWKQEMHQFPDIKSPMNYFLDPPYCIIHDRTSEQIINSHKRRVVIGNQNAMQLEHGFLQKLSQKLSKDLVKPVFGERKNFSSI